MSQEVYDRQLFTRHIVYVRNPNRAHKLLPLLEGMSVLPVKNWQDVTSLRRTLDTDTVVMLDNFGRWAVLGIFASALLQAPLILRLRGEFFREEYERTAVRSGPFRRLRYLANVNLAKLCIWKSRMVICNSEYLARAMKPYLRGKLVTIVHNPCTAMEPVASHNDTLQLPKEGFRLLTVTNMNLYSKVQPTIEAICEWMPLYLWKELDIYWTVCGSGHHEDRFRAAVREKGLQDRVRLLGRVDNVSELYRWCDVLVHFTRMDAFPNVPMEAMLHDKPVVTNVDSCGTREQVRDGENGRVVENAESFASALKQYAEDQTLRERHARAGHRLIQAKFSVEAQRPAMKRALEQLPFSNRKGVL